MPATRTTKRSLPSSTNPTSKRPRTISKPVQSTDTDEFQQVTKTDFVDRFRLNIGGGGDVYYQPDFIPVDLAQQWYKELLALETWYQPMLKMYGRSFPQSRHIAAYGTSPGMTLNYSGTSVIMHYPFPPALQAMQAKLEESLGVRFNHCMLNRYDDGSVYIGRHSDNLNNLVIASISLGAERAFILSPRLPSRGRGRGESLAGRKNESKEMGRGDEELAKRASHRWQLANGSLVVMQGQTQEYWKHEIPKEARVKDGRISLTFRQLV